MNNLDVTTNLAELEHGQVIFLDRFDADFCIEILHEGNERQEPADSQLSIEKNDSTAVEYVGKSSSITLRRNYGEYESRRQTSTNQTGGLSREMVTWLDSGNESSLTRRERCRGIDTEFCCDNGIESIVTVPSARFFPWAFCSIHVEYVQIIAEKRRFIEIPQMVNCTKVVKRKDIILKKSSNIPAVR
ncbi:hypothetical protein OUZ56_013795 [Daphnia magna]|uniref:Uncharacterized protein n=1 Tax=Daphnia magna TaxID=35525 RepID=A0ABQ9Z6Y5_9CRUS|nr:hypothetical protein OUZ56_013795 [Daphnia magna]